MTPLSTKEVPVEPTEEKTWKEIVHSLDWHYKKAIEKGVKIPNEFKWLIHAAQQKISAAPTASEKAEPVAWRRLEAIDNESAAYEYHDKEVYGGQPLFTLSPSAEQALRMAVDKIEARAKEWDAISGHGPQFAGELRYNIKQILSLTNKQDTSAEQGEPVLSKGSWRHNQGMLFSGTLRVARADFDTAPSEKVRDEILQNICDAMNTSPPSADAMFTPDEARELFEKAGGIVNNLGLITAVSATDLANMLNLAIVSRVKEGE